MADVLTAENADAARVGAAKRALRDARRRRSARSRTVTLLLALAGCGAFLAALCVGEYTVSVPEVLASLAGYGDDGTDFIVLGLRLPRALTGVLVGVAFGLSGAIFQRMLHNPLASPDIIGISFGASAAAVVAITVFGLGGAVVSGLAFGGALACAVGVYLLAWRRGVGGYRLVLVGVGVGALLSSTISYLLSRADIYAAQQAMVWLTGSLNGVGWPQALVPAAALAVLLPLTAALARPLRGLQFGDDSARGLGVLVEPSRFALVVVGVALTAVATAAAGPLAFVAFLADPIARRLTGGTALAPPALVGALVVLVADFTAQHLMGGVQFPAGVVTGAVGAPYLLWLMARSSRIGRSG
ncbi:FecCD family ABC transporter permease [Allonocardiopsis opalescens]|uniref:Iron complex transport system permease protein n=1 Tax=Allonocardiopsis opalescens TaxID=1144618 RepID=A0A2T0PZ37_9ACTN|nr:iron chelate uptake ABC transporter family permease subunit [Allonocardiopsis opalescens]PRX96816.1 iron complex transport system permease protein [Allonocardiopsis opalescens]